MTQAGPECTVLHRRPVLWPWQLPAGPGPDLVPVAVANPALESVWLHDPATGAGRPASPQAVHDPALVTGFDLIVRVIASVVPESRRAGHRASPRAEGGGDRVVVDHFADADVDVADPRLIVPRSGFGIRLPSLSHLRRVRLDADGTLISSGAMVLPDTGPYEVYGKEDPSVTWLDGEPWLSYVGVSDWGITPMLARGRWQDGAWVYARVAEAQGHHDNRDIKILPVRPGGLLWRHDRVNTLPWGPKRMTWATSPDEGRSWSASRPLLAGRFDWERHHVGAGAVPFPCEGPGGAPALASYYHGVHRRADAVAGVYQTGLAFFDAEAPDRELGRRETPVLSAWTDEAFLAARRAACSLPEAEFAARHGDFVIPAVVFSTGHTRLGERQLLFSGVNDFCIELAELPPLQALVPSGR